MVGGIAIRNVDPRVLAGSLGQSLLESLLEGADHVIDERLLGLLQLLDGRVPGGHLLLQSLLLHSEPVDLSLQSVMVNLEKVQCLGLGSHLLLHPLQSFRLPIALILQVLLKLLGGVSHVLEIRYLNLERHFPDVEIRLKVHRLIQLPFSLLFGLLGQLQRSLIDHILASQGFLLLLQSDHFFFQRLEGLCV